MSQIVMSKRNAGLETRGGYHKLPFAFTEQGIAMLSGVLRSAVAVGVRRRMAQASGGEHSECRGPDGDGPDRPNGADGFQLHH